MSFTTTRAQRRQLERDNAKLPVALQQLPPHEWPQHLRDGNRLRVWRSRHFLVQEFKADAPALVRLSINRTAVTGDRWQEGIDWETLQGIKNEIGYAGLDAVEVFPRQIDTVNVANMRHLWVLAEPLPFAWRRT